MLVGVLLYQREAGALDVRVDDRGYLIPLKPFAELSGCTLEVDETGARLATPLGTVELAPEDLWRSAGVVYVREKAIEEKLATPVSFDTGRYALNFDLPWRSGLGSTPSTPAPAPVPDVTAPKASLSTLQGELRYTRFADQNYLAMMTTLGGRLGPGYWRMRYQDNLDGQRYLRDYAWLYKRRRSLYLAGNQLVRLHPLFSSVEFTGLQAAWTNQSLNQFVHNPAPRELLSRRMQPISTFDGFGPAAGLAELRINGTVVERQAIGLDGRYQFVDVSVPARKASRVEILLYDRHNPRVPIEIIEQVRSASEFLLAGGAYVQMAGAGALGNLVQDQLDSRDRDSYAAFYQGRYGVSNRVTLEGAVQGADDAYQLMGGVVSRLSRGFTVSMGLGFADNAMGYNVDLEGLRPPWRMLVRSEATEAGFYPLINQDQYDHFMEVGYAVRPNLDVAAVARSWQRIGGEREYVLPAVMWRPNHKLWMRGRPDYDGAYRFDLHYRLRPSTRMMFGTIDDRGFAELSHRLNIRYRVTAETAVGGGMPNRNAVILHGLSLSRLRPRWMVGATLIGGQPGLLLGGQIELMPGVVARAQYESETLVEEVGFAQPQRLMISLFADLGVSRGRVVAAQMSSVRVDRGGIAGAVKIEAPPDFPDYDLADLAVLLDGRRVTRTREGGKFYIGNLEPGVRRLELDSDKLPIELAPLQAVVHAQVAGAAVTRLDFVVRPEFGLAGRVRLADGSLLAGQRVELIDDTGAVIQWAETDRFGLFRIDGVPIGVYTLQLENEGGTAAVPGPKRVVEIRDDFLFGQDLQLPAMLHERRAGTGVSGS
jgi:hypothetical protein